MKPGLDPGASCDERERNVAIAAALLALLLASGIMMAAVLMEPGAAPVATVAELPASGANAGTGSGGGFGASSGDGSALVGSGPGSGKKGEGRGSRAQERPDAPKGAPTGATAEESSPDGESLVSGDATELPRFGFSIPTEEEITPPDASTASGTVDGGDGEGEAGAGGSSGKGRFMGIPTAAKHIVYVLDFSSSMGVPDGRGERLKRELVQSISTLPEDTMFSVVLFGQGPAQVNDADQLTTPGGNRRTPNATVMPPGKPVRAGAGARQAAIGWVRSRDPAIGTWSHAWDSVKAALDMEPEAIFLLTDGEFDRSDFDDLVLTLEAHPHAPQVRLHTIAFATDGDVTSMRDLAARWRGVYRHVPLGP